MEQSTGDTEAQASRANDQERYMRRMHSEKNRLLSFKAWPNLPLELAKAGFYYMNSSDRVQCAFCENVLHNWEVMDKPLDEHKRHFPRCRFVLGLDVGNVPIPEDEIRAVAHKLCDETLQTKTSLADVVVRGPLVATHPNYRKYEARLETYNLWPAQHLVTAESLAKAGFFYTGSDDEVRCYFCSGGLRKWRIGDNPWDKHQAWFPRCAYVKQAKQAEGLIPPGVRTPTPPPTQSNSFDIGPREEQVEPNEKAKQVVLKIALLEKWDTLLDKLAMYITNQAEFVDLVIYCNIPPTRARQSLQAFRNKGRPEVVSLLQYICHGHLQGTHYHRLTVLRNAFVYMGIEEHFERAMWQSDLKPNDYFGPHSPLLMVETQGDVIENEISLEEKWGQLLDGLARDINTRENFHDLSRCFGVTPNDSTEILELYPKDMAQASWALLSLILRRYVEGTRLEKLTRLSEAYRYMGKINTFRETMEAHQVPPDVYVPMVAEPEEADPEEKRLQECWDRLLEEIARQCSPRMIVSMVRSIIPGGKVDQVQEDHPTDSLTTSRLLVKYWVRDWIQGTKSQKIRQIIKEFRENEAVGLIHRILLDFGIKIPQQSEAA